MVLDSFKISDFMSTSLLILEPNTSLIDTIKAMNDKGVGSAIIMSDNKLLGIVTERDFLHAFARGNTPPDVSKVSVNSIMSKKIIKIDKNKNVAHAETLMKKKNIRHLVVTENENVVGIISLRDLFIAYQNETYKSHKALETIKKMAITYTHEINNPLSIAISNVQIINEKFKLNELDLTIEALERIKNVIKKIADLKTYQEKEYILDLKMVDIHK